MQRALATLDGEIQAGFFHSDRGWGWRISQEYFWLIEPAASSRRHTILPADIRFTGKRNPTDSGSGNTTSPIQRRERL